MRKKPIIHAGIAGNDQDAQNVVYLTEVLLSSDIFANSHGIYSALTSGSAGEVGVLFPIYLENILRCFFCTVLSYACD